MTRKIPSLSLLTVNGPSTWPSVGLVSSELIKTIRSLYPHIKTFRILESAAAPVNDEVWIVPVGMVHHQFFKWLKDNFKTPYQRPRIIFFLGGEGAKQCYNLYFHQNLFRIDDEWVVSSHVEKNLLDHFFPGNHRTHVLYYPVSKIFKPVASLKKKAELRKKLNLPLAKTTSLVLYAGRISVQKNIFSLLEVLEKNPTLHLVICGDVDSLGLPHFDSDTKVHLPIVLVEEISKRKLSKRIEFRNFLSQQELREMMQACDYQISLSSHYGEDFGYSIAQGLAAGLKSILSHWGGHLNWKHFFKESELTYVKLDWVGPHGSPILKGKLSLPKKSRNSFLLSYTEHFKTNFKNIVTNKDFKNRKVVVEVSSDLKEYWDEFAKTPKTSMYKSCDDKHFKMVVEYYKGK